METDAMRRRSTYVLELHNVSEAEKRNAGERLWFSFFSVAVLKYPGSKQLGGERTCLKFKAAVHGCVGLILFFPKFIYSFIYLFFSHVFHPNYHFPSLIFSQSTLSQYLLSSNSFPFRFPDLLGILSKHGISSYTKTRHICHYKAGWGSGFTFLKGKELGRHKVERCGEGQGGSGRS